MSNPCEYCIYASEATDSTGKDYYQCELDEFPDNHPNAECSKIDEEFFYV